MKIYPPSACRTALALLSAACVFSLAAQAPAAEPRRKNPTSKLYVADMEGISSINTGEKIEDLTKKSVHTAEGVIIETGHNSSNALVLSNGTGLFCDPSTRVEVRRFMQEPFSPNRTDLEVEPSVSQTSAFLPRGTIGLCTSKLVAGSTMVYSTRHATVAIRGRRVVIEASDDATVVSLLEGDVTIRGDLLAGGESLRPGQQAIITRRSPSEPPAIKIQAIPDADVNRLGEKVSQACMARKTVYFDVAERKNNEPGDVFSQDVTDTQEIKPVEVIPGKIPTENTASTYKISKPGN